MNNTKRGFRAVVFDVFGTAVFRPSLEDCYASSKAAISASERESIDLLAHYKDAIAEQLRQSKNQSSQYAEALKGLE
jgi:hypothetical protein